MAVRPGRVLPVAYPGVGRRAGEAAAKHTRSPLSPCPELDCVRSLLPLDAIISAERRALAVGVGAERVLIARGAISEEDYVRALARHIGAAFEPLDDMPRYLCPLTDEQLIHASASGMLPLRIGDQTVAVVAPKNDAARRFCLVDSHRLPCKVRLTTGARLQRFVDRHAGRAVARKAADELKTYHADVSAAHRHAGMRVALSSLAGAVLIGVAAAPAATFAVVGLALGVMFLAWTILRVVASGMTDRFSSRPAPISDRDLPDYTVIVALHREERVIRKLVAALNGLNYPREKLQIMLVVEPHDVSTRVALGRLDLDSEYQIVVAPRYGPQTKPKALNAALPFARGEFTAVFDAEDRPEQNQLRDAVACFRRGSKRLACVQGRLTIDNTADSWLARLFTAEYCGQFDVLLPALARWHLPLPLGGSSNHFRTRVLREVGAWDPYNVTEDADLGMRLARYGYETSVFGSTTYEEAPARIKPWISQRTRWFKGWLQTWLVHMRAPVKLLREVGLGGFFTLQLVVGGTVVAALVHPLFLGWLVWRAASGGFHLDTASIADMALAATCGTIFVTGYAATLTLMLTGLARRKLLAHAAALVFVPVLWLLLSAAAWRALTELFYAPYKWAKTEHGHARTSRQRRMAA